MSVASDLPPDVFIPAGARTRVLREVSDPRFRAANASDAVAAVSAVRDYVPDYRDVFAPAAPAVAANGAEVTDLDSWRPHYVGAQVGGRRRSAAGLRIRPEELVLASPVTSPRVAGASLRLTHRGAVVLSVASVLLAIGVVAIAWLSSAASGTGSSSAGGAGSSVPAVVTVHSGDSLWSIASTIEPNRDPRVVVDDLRTRNHLDSDSVTPGQQLRVR